MSGMLTQLSSGSGGFALNINGTIISGGSATISAASGDVVMTLTNGSAVTIGTTMSANADEAYRQFITEKRDAMTMGGTATLNGSSQIFSGGYLNAAVSGSLLSLNGVRGTPDSANHRCNLNFNPTNCFWFEPADTRITVSGSPVSSGGTIVARTRPPCITCDTYNDLFAMEMVMYHYLNNIAWKIMHRDFYITVGDYPDGLWPRFLAVMAAWNFYVYKSEYLTYNASLRESLNVNIGWANPSCDQAGFVCVADVNRIQTQTETGLEIGLLYYLGNLMTDGQTHRDNNVYSAGNPLPFIISYNTSGATLFCGGNISSSSVKSTLNTELDAALGSSYTDSSYNGLRQMINSATVVTDVQDFYGLNNQGHWKLGLVAANVNGGGYAAQNFGLGASIKLVDYSPTPTRLDTYSITTTWWTQPHIAGGVTQGPITLSDTPQTLTTYGLEVPND